MIDWRWERDGEMRLTGKGKVERHGGGIHIFSRGGDGCWRLISGKSRRGRGRKRRLFWL